MWKLVRVAVSESLNSKFIIQTFLRGRAVRLWKEFMVEWMIQTIKEASCKKVSASLKNLRFFMNLLLSNINFTAFREFKFMNLLLCEIFFLHWGLFINLLLFGCTFYCFSFILLLVDTSLESLRKNFSIFYLFLSVLDDCLFSCLSFWSNISYYLSVWCDNKVISFLFFWTIM